MISPRLTIIVIFFTGLAGCCAGEASAQYHSMPAGIQDTISSKGFDPHRLFTGGSIGLSFGNMTYVNLSPLIGYRFSEMLAGGIQVNAQYESVRYTDGYNSLFRKEKYTVLGVGVFGRFYPVPQLFIHLQPEMNFIFGKVKYFDGTTPEQKYRRHVPGFLAGAGYAQPVGGNSAFTLMILYDVLQEPDSPYGNQPVFRAGVDLGF